MVEKIEIFGKDLELDDERLLDLIIHREVRRVAKETVEDIKNIFAKHKTIEELVNHEEAFFVLFALVFLKCGKFLEELDITEIDGDDIQKLYHEEPTNYFWDSFENLKNEYKKILIFEESNQESKLRKLYNDLSMRQELEQAAYMDVYELIPLIQYLLQQKGIADNPITLEDEEEGVELFEYLKVNKLEKRQAYEIAYQLFCTDPSEPEYYDWCILHFPEEISNLVQLERLAGYEPTRTLLEKGLQALFEKMPHSTEEETVLVKKKMEEIRTNVGISESDTIKKVDKMLYQFDLEARTFQNIEFATRELRKKAEEDYLELSKVCEGVEQFDENSCEQHREAICKKDYVQEIVDIFIKKIDDRKITIWKEEDAVKIEKIFLKTNINDEASIRNSVSEIESIGRTDDKMNYINALTGMNNENKELFIKFYEWKDRKFIRKYLIQVILWIAGIVSLLSGIGILVIIIAVIYTMFKAKKINKMKKTWELLTLNGKLVHPQLLSGQNIEINNEVKIEIEEDKMFCKSCGKEINSSDLFCKYCGTKIEK